MIAPEEVLAHVRVLPTLSAASLRLSELARDPRSGAVDFEKVIRPEPALTANLLRLTNSAYFGLRCRAETVRQAITLLGLKRVHEVAAAAALGPILPARLPGYEVEASGFWLHCVAVAVLSERLAEGLGLKRPDLTFTAGLLHDVGKLAICAFVSGARAPILEAVRGGLAFAAAERSVLGTDHGELGGLVAEAWSLPRAAADVARWHHEPAKAPGGADRLLVDLVHVADALSHALGLGATAGGPAPTVDGGVEERLGVTARRLERVAGESLDPIRELAALFTTGRAP